MLYINQFHYLYLYTPMYKVHNSKKSEIHNILFHKHNQGQFYFYQPQNYKLSNYQLLKNKLNNLQNIYYKFHYFQNIQVYNYIKELHFFLQQKHIKYNQKDRFDMFNILHCIFCNLYWNHHHKILINTNNQRQNHLYSNYMLNSLKNYSHYIFWDKSNIWEENLIYNLQNK